MQKKTSRSHDADAASRRGRFMARLPCRRRQAPRHRTKQELVYRDPARRDHALRAGARASGSSSTSWPAARGERHPGARGPADPAVRGPGASTCPTWGPPSPPSRASPSHEVFTVMEGLEMVATRAAAERARPPTEADGLERAGGGHGRGAAPRGGTRSGPTSTRASTSPSAAWRGMPMLLRDDRARPRALGPRPPLLLQGVLVHRVEQAQREHRRAAGRHAGPGPARRSRRSSSQHNRGALPRLHGLPAGEGKCGEAPGRGAPGRAWPSPEDGGGPARAPGRRRHPARRSTTTLDFRRRFTLRAAASRWTASAWATASASCPWRAGTARPTGSRAT